MKKKFKPEHVNIEPEDLKGNNGASRYLFFPGSDHRAKTIAEHFKNLKVKEHPRGHNLYMGTLEHEGKKIDVGSISSGMGTPSLDIILNELLKLGAKRFLRVGSSGSLQYDRVKIGDFVIATGAVRDEGASKCYMPLEYPAIASTDMILSSLKAAKNLGLEKKTHLGIIHSKDSLYGREFEQGPLAMQNTTYMKTLTDAGVLASEMESSMLFILSSLYENELIKQNIKQHHILAGTICMIISAGPGFVKKDIMKKLTDQVTELAKHTFFELYKTENNLISP